MRKLFKQLASCLLIPLTRWYLRKERTYSKGEVRIKVFPGVFHPGLFPSTNFLLTFLKSQNIRNKSFLELGCGSGLISIEAAKAGAIVTASDLSTKAIENTKGNLKLNNIHMTVVHSDLFGNLGQKIFDWIIINPPYYPHLPKNENELAWYCGENFEYFEKLFSSLGSHIHSSSQVIMVLTKGCDLERIFEIGRKNGFYCELIRQQYSLFDGRDYLFQIQMKTSIKPS